MTRFLSLLSTELKFQWRHGFIIAAFIVTLVWALLLGLLPDELKLFWFGIVAALDVSSIGLLFGYGLGVLDKNQHAISAIRLTPVASINIALARVISLSLLVIVTLLCLALLSLSLGQTAAVLPGIIFMSIFFSALGVTASRRFASINQFILFFALSSIVWALPILYYADIVSSLGWLFLPSGGAMLFFKNSITSESFSLLLIASLVQLCWSVLVFYLGERWTPLNYAHRFGGY